MASTVEAQRQADHARGVTQHPLDRQVGLAGVGGAQDRRDARWGQACGTITHAVTKVATSAPGSSAAMAGRVRRVAMSSV